MKKKEPEETVDDFLYVMVENKFYRLDSAQITRPQNEIHENEQPLFTILKDLREKNALLTDIQQGEDVDSCACLALNVGYFEDTINEKRERLVTAIKALRAKEKK